MLEKKVGRSWLCVLGNGHEITVASRNFKQLPQGGPAREAREGSRTAREPEIDWEEDVSDGDADSVGPEAEER